MGKFKISIVRDTKGYKTRQMPLNMEKIRMKATYVCENHNDLETCILLITKTARDEMLGHICWGNHDTRTNRVEQGGLLAGVHYEDPSTKLHYCVALHAYPLTNAKGNPTFLDAKAANWAECFAAMDRDNVATGLDMNTMGWFHTHPNGLSTFMSGTDRHTQSTMFNGETNFALVLNPHTGSWKAFRGPSASDSMCYMLETDDLATLCGESDKVLQKFDMDALREEIRMLVAEEVARQLAERKQKSTNNTEKTSYKQHKPKKKKRRNKTKGADNLIHISLIKKLLQNNTRGFIIDKVGITVNDGRRITFIHTMNRNMKTAFQLSGKSLTPLCHFMGTAIRMPRNSHHQCARRPFFDYGLNPFPTTLIGARINNTVGARLFSKRVANGHAQPFYAKVKTDNHTVCHACPASSPQASSVPESMPKSFNALS